LTLSLDFLREIAYAGYPAVYECILKPEVCLG
jgi:hypothetical protein